MLRRKAPLSRGGSLKRKTRVRGKSDKRREQDTLRRVFVKTQLSLRPHCEAGKTLHVATAGKLGHGYWEHSEEVHEPLMRSQGGSVLCVENSVAICRSCHRQVHDHTAIAYAVGLLVKSHDAPRSWFSSADEESGRTQRISASAG